MIVMLDVCFLLDFVLNWPLLLSNVVLRLALEAPLTVFGEEYLSSSTDDLRFFLGINGGAADF